MATLAWDPVFLCEKFSGFIRERIGTKDFSCNQWIWCALLRPQFDSWCGFCTLIDIPTINDRGIWLSMHASIAAHSFGVLSSTASSVAINLKHLPARRYGSSRPFCRKIGEVKQGITHLREDSLNKSNTKLSSLLWGATLNAVRSKLRRRSSLSSASSSGQTGEVRLPVPNLQQIDSAAAKAKELWMDGCCELSK